MEILTRPRDFIRRGLRVDETLIYGDLQDGQVVLASTKQLPGYVQEGEVYVRRFGLDEPEITLSINRWGLSKCFAAHEDDGKIIALHNDDPEPSLLSEHRPYAYACSPELVRELNPERAQLYDEENPFFLKLPRDAVLAHEGSHLSLNSKPHQKHAKCVFFDKFYTSLLRLGLDQKISQDEVMDETIGIFMELKYIQQFYPKLEQSYRDWRARETKDPHRTAYRLISNEPKEVARFISALWLAKTWPMKKIVEFAYS